MISGAGIDSGIRASRVEVAISYPRSAERTTGRAGPGRWYRPQRGWGAGTMTAGGAGSAGGTMITGDAAGGSGTLAAVATPVGGPGTLAGRAASALSICGPSVRTGPRECGDPDGCVEAEG